MKIVEYENGTPIFELTLDECRQYGLNYPCYGASKGFEPGDPDELETTAGSIDYVRDYINHRI